jgi:hypothetical protein
MILERDPQGLTQVLLLEAAEVQGVVLARGTDVVDDQVVVGDLVALLGVVPEPAGVLDQLADMIDEGVVDGDDALGAVARGGLLLQEGQAALIELSDVPVGLGEEAVEAGLVGGLGELAVDATDVLALGDEQPGEVLGEVAALWLVGQQVTEVLEGLVDHRGEVDDAGHGRLPGREHHHPGQCTKIKRNGSPKPTLQEAMNTFVSESVGQATHRR